MDASNKKILLNIAYWSMAVLTIVLGILFLIAMPIRQVAMYQRVVYYIWTILLILTMLCDIVATKMQNYKYIVALVIGALAFLCLLVGIIVYAGMNIDLMIPYYALGRFLTVIGFSVVLTIMAIVTSVIGESIIELSVARKGK
ncbi:MAG: hypothetical protein IJE91_01635 [Clostridia bacterium]|nr:hypothetical protein [Clostridia bacterium]